MDKQRVYFVIDMKSFFASVECVERGLDAETTKLVVADEERTKSTVCLAVSPEMKRLGVRNRCRLFEIPDNIDYIIAKPRMKKYIEYAAEIYGIYLKYIDKNDIHVYSIDECFIDVTDYLKLYNVKVKDFAIRLMNEIKDVLGIPASVGIGTNLYLAKIALDITAKHSPDKIGWLDEDRYKKTLWNHKPITDFWQISNGIATRLQKFGIEDMEGIARADEKIFYDEFGINAELLIDHAWGKESCLMQDIKNYKGKSKSLSSSQILPCNYGVYDAKMVMQEMVQAGCYNLARGGYVTQLLHLYVGYGDQKHDGAKGTVRMPVTTNLFSVIGEYSDKLFDQIVDPKRPIRKIGYDFSELSSVEGEQYDFFTDLNKIAEEKRLVDSVLELQDKYGKNAVLKGIDLHEKATQRDRNKMIGGHSGGES